MISSNSRGFETASKLTLLLNNLALIGVLIIFFAALIPMAVITNQRANYFLEKGRDLILRLIAAGTAKEAGMPTQEILGGTLVDVIQEALDLQDERKKRMTPLIWGLFAQTILFGFFTALGSLISLRVVLRLRESEHLILSSRLSGLTLLPDLLRQSRAQLGVLGPVPMTPPSGKLNPASIFSPTVPSPTSPHGLTSHVSSIFVRFKRGPTMASSRVNSQESTLSPETIAMTRLAADLSLAVPLVLMGSFVLPTCCFIGWLRHDTTWIMRELQLDGLCWPWA